MTVPLSAESLARVVDVGRSRGWPPLWVVADGPRAQDAARLVRIRRAGAKVAAFCSAEAPVARPSADVCLYRLEGQGGQLPQLGAPAGRRRKDQLALYTWDCAAVGPGANRLLVGLMLFFSKYDGVMPSGYPVTTVRWEAFREGVNDYRCLSALRQAMRDARDVPSCREAVAAGGGLLVKLRERVKPDVRSTSAGISLDEMDRIRDDVVRAWDAIATRLHAARTPSVRTVP